MSELKALKLRNGDYYYDEIKFIFTEQYHKRRGSCCGSGCRHCPYNPKFVKGNTILLTTPKDYKRRKQVEAYIQHKKPPMFDNEGVEELSN